MDGNGIGRGPYQDLWARGFRHLLPGESMVRLPNEMPGLDRLLAEIAAFPDGKHDDQVDALSYLAAYAGR